ncbi:MAG: A/G-specific adenine glycosylase [Methanoregula sp.]
MSPLAKKDGRKKSTDQKPDHQVTLDTLAPGFSRNNLSPASVKKFREIVYSFYLSRGRHDMLWRHTTDPYRILVSEIMLQQTQVERVAVKYPEFIAAFPDFPALASAPLRDVLAAWQGLGYNRRAISLKKCAEVIVSEYAGVLSLDPVVLATLPGIGKATASSICAFAFNMPVVFIETNIRRVFIHFFFCDADRVSDAEIAPLVQKMLDRDHPREWYWALMDLGTELKRRGTNPNRRSSGYTRQAPFEGSDRKIRGIILKHLVGKKALLEQEIILLAGVDPGRTKNILADLKKEGFVVRQGEEYRLAE